MPISNILKFGLTTVSGIFFGYFTIYFLNQEVSQRSEFRQPSSVQFQKMGFDQLAKEYFEIQIQSILTTETDLGVSHLKATITAKKDIPQNVIQYHWKLKPEMTPRNSLVGYLPQLKKGEIFEILLQTDHFSKEVQRHIQLLLIGQIDSHNIHRQLTLASRPEDSLEYMIANESVEKIEDSKQKIKKMGLRNKFHPKKIIK